MNFNVFIFGNNTCYNNTQCDFKFNGGGEIDYQFSSYFHVFKLCLKKTSLSNQLLMIARHAKRVIVEFSDGKKKSINAAECLADFQAIIVGTIKVKTDPVNVRPRKVDPRVFFFGKVRQVDGSRATNAN